MCASCAFVRTCVRSGVRACVRAWVRACARALCTFACWLAHARARIYLFIYMSVSLSVPVYICMGYKKAGICAFIRLSKLFDSCRISCAVKTWWCHRADRCSAFIFIVPV